MKQYDGRRLTSQGMLSGLAVTLALAAAIPGVAFVAALLLHSVSLGALQQLTEVKPGA